MDDKTVKELEVFVTPFRRQEIKVQHVTHESGLNMLELKIREGRRFTILELDAELAGDLGKLMVEWSAQNQGSSET